MSLLLLFGPPTTFMCWGAVATETSTFTTIGLGVDTWNYWSTYTWSQIQTSGRTWEYLAGNWFATASTGTSAWSYIIEGSCPAV